MQWPPGLYRKVRDEFREENQAFIWLETGESAAFYPGTSIVFHEKSVQGVEFVEADGLGRGPIGRFLQRLANEHHPFINRRDAVIVLLPADDAPVDDGKKAAVLGLARAVRSDVGKRMSNRDAYWVISTTEEVSTS